MVVGQPCDVVAVPIAGVAQMALVWVAASRAGYRLIPKRPRMTPELKRLAMIAAPAALAGGVVALGWLVTGKTVHTKDGDPMKFVSFEDTTGLYETVFFPKMYNRFCYMLNEMRPYILKGKVEEDFGSITLTVTWIRFLDRYKRSPNH